MAGSHFGTVFKALVFIEQAHQGLKFPLAEIVVFNDGFQALPVRPVSRGKGMDHGQGKLSFPQVSPHCFSQGLGIGGVIQQVVGNLKGNSQMVSVVCQGRFLGLGCIGQQGADLAGPLEQHRRLAPDDL